MDRIIVYGVGKNCDALLMNMSDDEKKGIIAYVDKNEQGKEYCSSIVVAPDEINKIKYDYLYLTNMDYQPIIEELTNKYKVEVSCILTPHQLNMKYVIPKLDFAKRVFFAKSDRVYCFSFLFQFIEPSYSFDIIYLLQDNERFEKEEEIRLENKTFVFGGYDIERFQRNGFFKYINDVYPCSKKYMCLFDLCDGDYGLIKGLNGAFDIDYLHSFFDKCITYHKKDADKYNLYYYPQFYPSRFMTSFEDDPSISDFDVFFVGNAKNRLNLIYNVYNRLSTNGIKCVFILNGVDKEEQYRKGVLYNRDLTYSETLKYVSKSKCILEICEKGDETSLRYAEAVEFGKKLLCNDPSVIEMEFFGSGNVYYFEKAEDLDIDWIKKDYCDYRRGDSLYTEKLAELLNW